MIIKTASLIPAAKKIICDKGTERAFTGCYTDLHDEGTFLCRQCGLALFRSGAKFASGCGWPSFDQDIVGAVREVPDPDGQRTEIVCSRCDAHLGHVFRGEGFTRENTRHCVNSCSLDFVTDLTVRDTEEAIFAAGCFWGVEYYFKELPGVLKTEVGYTGGELTTPSYHAVCRGDSGHYEAIRVIYDVDKIDFKTVAKFFFEIHHPEQSNGQGPDIGKQYQSAIFYYTEKQKKISEELKNILIKNGLDVATQILPVVPFWPAEDYHQDYYAKNGQTPYCHIWTKRF